MSLEEDIQQRKFKSEGQKTLINVLYTYHHLVTKSTPIFKSFGITRQQYNVLRILRGQHPNAITINIIKERMLDKMSDASRIVERLRKKELINRDKSNTDRRAVEILISSKGLKLLKKIDPIIEEHEVGQINLSNEEAITLNELLDKLRNNQ